MPVGTTPSTPRHHSIHWYRSIRRLIPWHQPLDRPTVLRLSPSKMTKNHPTPTTPSPVTKILVVSMRMRNKHPTPRPQTPARKSIVERDNPHKSQVMSPLPVRIGYHPQTDRSNQSPIQTYRPKHLKQRRKSWARDRQFLRNQETGIRWNPLHIKKQRLRNPANPPRKSPQRRTIISRPFHLRLLGVATETKYFPQRHHTSQSHHRKMAKCPRWTPHGVQ